MNNNRGFFNGNFQYTSDEDLRELELELHKVFIKKGFTDGDTCCSTKCTISITIGREGNPIPTISCQLICDC